MDLRSMKKIFVGFTYTGAEVCIYKDSEYICYKSAVLKLFTSVTYLLS